MKKNVSINHSESKIMKTLNFTVIGFLLFHLNIYCDNTIPHLNIVVHRSGFSDYFDQSNAEQAIKLNKLITIIEKNIRTEYRKAWNEYYERRNNIINKNPNQDASCIRRAIDNLPTKLNETEENELYINFGFDKNHMVIYNRFGLAGKLKVDEYKGDVDGNGEYKSVIPNFLYIYNAYKDYNSMIFQAEKNGCIYKRLVPHLVYDYLEKIKINGLSDIFISIKKIFFSFSELYRELAEWRYIGEHSSTLKSTIFHEMVHMALKYARIGRGSDEATVEDTELKIFPGGNSYEYNFDYLTWLNDWKKGYKAPLDSNGVEGDYLLPYRKFNPPVEMKYDRKVRILNFFYFRVGYYDDTFCDDARCESIFPRGVQNTYGIPQKCCNQNK